MSHKRLTERFPFLLPLRRAQRKCFFYAKLYWHRKRYAKTRAQTPLAHTLYETKTQLINADSGHDIAYQHNKVHNIRLCTDQMNGLLIRPGETFSFWFSAHHADRHTPYKDGLVLVNGEIQAVKGGGLCQLSNLLFWMCLHTPMTIVERHPHNKKALPTPPGDVPAGVDATVSEGWLDLKVKNETASTFQFTFVYDGTELCGRVCSDDPSLFTYGVEGRDLHYVRQGGHIYEEIDLYRHKREPRSGAIVSTAFLYHNRCLIDYPLPKDVPVVEQKGA